MSLDDRDLILSRLEQELARARRHRDYAFALLEVKLFNSTSAPDARSFLSGKTRCEDSVFHLAPGSLTCLLTHHKDSSDASRAARRMWDLKPADFASFGIAVSQSSYESAEAMWEAARRAAEEAHPKTRIHYADPKQGNLAVERLELETDLRLAIKENRIEAYFQPIVDLKQGHISGFEALARWNRKEKLLLPKDFLEVADECGLLPQLDRSVMDQALQQLAIWKTQVDRPIRVNVNLSNYHFFQDEERSRLIEVLDRHSGLVADLRFDLSEKVGLEAAGVATLTELRKRHIGFHLDDFGVSAESFQCLNNFSFDSLKVDRTLTAEMEEEVQAELVNAVLKIAKRMGLRTTAEGLVTHAQLEELRNLGSDEAQGFFFSPAVAAKAALAMLRDNPRW